MVSEAYKAVNAGPRPVDAVHLDGMNGARPVPITGRSVGSALCPFLILIPYAANGELPYGNSRLDTGGRRHVASCPNSMRLLVVERALSEF